MTGDDGYRRVGASAAICGGALMVAGLPLPWISTGVIGDVGSRGLDLPAIWVPTLLAAAATIGFAVAWLSGREGPFSSYCALAATLPLLLSAGFLGTIEASGNLLPSAFLPETIRRSAGVVGAGAGVWITLAGSGLVVFAASGLGRWQFRLHSWESQADRTKAGVLCVLLALVVVVGWLRYRPWIGSSALGHGLDITGQAAPLVGPLSLLALCLLVGAFVPLVFSRFQLAGLVVAVTGWLFTFLAAITVIAGESLARVRVGDVVDGSSGDGGVTFHAALAAWGTYLCGVLIAVVGGFLVCWRHQSGGD